MGVRHIYRAVLALSLLLPLATSAEPVLVRYDEQQLLKTSLNWLGRRPDALTLPPRVATPVPGSLSMQFDAKKFEHTPPSRQGHTAIGKLLFVNSSGATESCAATLVGRQGLLLTAANCLVDRSGNVSTDIVFVTLLGTPAQQLYSVECLAFPSEWSELPGPDAWRYNYAFLKLHGQTTFGGLGITNALPPKKLDRLGYSGALGDRTQMGSESTVVRVRGGLVASRNDSLAAGSSGNPWMRNQVVQSLSSHYDPAQPEIILGPQFTGATMELMNIVRDGCIAPAAPAAPAESDTP